MDNSGIDGNQGNVLTASNLKVRLLCICCPPWAVWIWISRCRSGALSCCGFSQAKQILLQFLPFQSQFSYTFFILFFSATLELCFFATQVWLGSVRSVLSLASRLGWGWGSLNASVWLFPNKRMGNPTRFAESGGSSMWPWLCRISPFTSCLHFYEQNSLSWTCVLAGTFQPQAHGKSRDGNWDLQCPRTEKTLCASGDSFTSPQFPPPVVLLGLGDSPGEEEKLI